MNTKNADSPPPPPPPQPPPPPPIPLTPFWLKIWGFVFAADITVIAYANFLEALSKILNLWRLQLGLAVILVGGCILWLLVRRYPRILAALSLGLLFCGILYYAHAVDRRPDNNSVAETQSYASWDEVETDVIRRKTEKSRPINLSLQGGEFVVIWMHDEGLQDIQHLHSFPGKDYSPEEVEKFRGRYRAVPKTVEKDNIHYRLFYSTDQPRPSWYDSFKWLLKAGP